MIYELPTRSNRVYHGKYPHAIWSLGYSNSRTQAAIAAFLGNQRTVHIEMNCGRRFIGDTTDFVTELFAPKKDVIGWDFSRITRQGMPPIKPMSQEQYAEMMSIVNLERKKG